MEKKDVILGYITNQISLLPSLASQYTNAGKYYSRISFLNLKRFLVKFFNQGSDRLIIIPGLRGVGKTTLLFQLYELIKKNNMVESDHLVYLTCDDIVKRLNSSINEIIDVYEEKIIGEAFESHKKKIILLIDEAHYDSSWEIVVKRLYDRSKNILIFVSGSSSIALETSTDTVRRAIIERIFPLNFLEYNLLKNNVFPPKETTKGLREAFFNSKNADEVYTKLMPLIQKIRTQFLTKIPSFKLEFEKFLTSGGFPNTLYDTDKKVYTRIINVLEKIIYEDLPRIKTITRYKNQSKIFPMLNILAGKNENISYRSFSKDVEGLTLAQTSEIMTVLNKAGVLEAINVSSDSIKKTERRSKKYFFASPCIRASLLWNIGKFNKSSHTLGLLLENGVFNSLNKTKIYTNLIQQITYPENDIKLSDFVVETPHGKVIIECGWGTKTIGQVKRTMESEKAIYGIIISDSETRLDENNNIIFIPKELFFLF